MKSIIARIYCVCLLLAACLADAGAQAILDERVRISDLSVSRSDGKLFVAMSIDVTALDVKSNNEIIITPVVRGKSDEVRLKPVMIAGRNRYYHHLRNTGADADSMDVYRHGSVSVVEYRTVAPYRSWMGGADMNAVCETRGCCSESESMGVDRLARLDVEPKVYEPRLIYVSPKAEPKIRDMQGSAYIDFPVNRTEIYPGYRNNPAELQKIWHTIDTVKSDPDVEIIALTFKGYASPEGSYSNNTRLAKGRTAALKEYVRKLYDFPAGLIATDYEPEDWEGLEKYVAESYMDNKEDILAIIRGGLEPDAKDRKIKTAYPREYAFLLKNVYPGLRHSDYVVRYKIRQYTDIAEIRRMLKTQPQKLSLQEMYMAAGEMEQGSDEYAETFEIAVRMYPDDATANLNAACTALARRDMKAAERYLAKAGDTANAVYTRGVYAAMNGDYDAAGRLFAEAERGGLKEAGAEIRRLEEFR
ncbi:MULTISPECIES: DUF3868 domain-containing protein [unclassified Prevotella]|uniref:DUF3868 domain-containing protein n=1 Tax=unclassified Prevotella TaxID=2638335 RepID=UPI000CE9B6F0|nr:MULTISPECIES: DUF3868 domain-containing protein [unclassified Prevotella]MCX4293502.1 DUF3868 domain-containing protein [Prevotella sp.]NPD54705.1 DUF3868 domain-containing protein [Prevotella sp. PTAC]GAY27316.1 DUF3868 domain-containing protein [Prevotella sp. MGM1]